jgi:multidrug efflux pump subunit AcrA (membrane-fusion protein)
MMQKTLLAVMVGLLVLGLAGCGGQVEETPVPEAEPDFAPVVSVTGEVVPVLWATLSAQAGGTVVELAVEPGDEVMVDGLLVRLDPTDAELAFQQAEAALQAAQAQLALLEAGARSEEIAAAEGQVQAAEAALAQAIAQRDELTGAGAAAARAQLVAAMLEEKTAEDAYDQVEGRIHGWIEEQAIRRLRAAEEARAAAEAQLAQLEGESGAQIRAAEAAVSAAAAQEHIAQAQLALLSAGATGEEIDAAEAAVAQARAASEAAQVALNRTEMRAGFAGTVGMVHVRVGELVAPGQPLVTLGDLSALRVETTDLDEIDVAKVAVGQDASVSFDALPERVFYGRVTRISPMSEPGTGGVNYTVVVELDDIDPLIRWGMTAFVYIEVGD